MIQTQEKASRTVLQLTVISQDLGKLHFRLLMFPASLFNHSRPLKKCLQPRYAGGLEPRFEN